MLYENYSVDALTDELYKIRRLKSLVNELDKPSNFTYMDIYNLHHHLENVELHLKELIRSKST